MSREYLVQVAGEGGGEDHVVDAVSRSTLSGPAGGIARLVLIPKVGQLNTEPSLEVEGGGGVVDITSGTTPSVPASHTAMSSCCVLDKL